MNALSFAEYVVTTEHGRAQAYANSADAAYLVRMIEDAIDLSESDRCEKALDLINDIRREVFDSDHYDKALDLLADENVTKETQLTFLEFGNVAEKYATDLDAQLTAIADVLHERL